MSSLSSTIPVEEQTEKGYPMTRMNRMCLATSATVAVGMEMAAMHASKQGDVPTDYGSKRKDDGRTPPIDELHAKKTVFGAGEQQSDHNGSMDMKPIKDDVHDGTFVKPPTALDLVDNTNNCFAEIMAAATPARQSMTAIGRPFNADELELLPDNDQIGRIPSDGADSVEGYIDLVTAVGDGIDTTIATDFGDDNAAVTPAWAISAMNTGMSETRKFN